MPCDFRKIKKTVFHIFKFISGVNGTAQSDICKTLCQEFSSIPCATAKSIIESKKKKVLNQRWGWVQPFLCIFPDHDMDRYGFKTKILVFRNVFWTCIRKFWWIKGSDFSFFYWFLHLLHRFSYIWKWIGKEIAERCTVATNVIPRETKLVIWIKVAGFWMAWNHQNPLVMDVMLPEPKKVSLQVSTWCSYGFFGTNRWPWF